MTAAIFDKGSLAHGKYGDRNMVKRFARTGNDDVLREVV